MAKMPNHCVKVVLFSLGELDSKATVNSSLSPNTNSYLRKFLKLTAKLDWLPLCGIEVMKIKDWSKTFR